MKELTNGELLAKLKEAKEARERAIHFWNVAETSEEKDKMTSVAEGHLSEIQRIEEEIMRRL